MKNILLAIALVSLLGCAAKPPKMGTILDVNSPIVLSDKSSDALRLLYDNGATGVRDLTLTEFDESKSDIEKFNSLVETEQKFNRAAYEAGGIALGLASGIATGQVLGYAAITSIFSNDMPENYMFAWDFNSFAKTYNTNGVSNKELLDASKKAVQALSLELGFTDSPEQLVIKQEVNNDENRGALVSSINVTSLAGPNDYKNRITVLGFCNENERECKFDAAVMADGKVTVMGAIVISKIASELSSDYVFYLPPNKAQYRLPMIVRGGTGEIEYLVEKE